MRNKIYYSCNTDVYVSSSSTQAGALSSARVSLSFLDLLLIFIDITYFIDI